MNIFFRIFLKPKYFWVFGFEFGPGFEPIPIIQTQRPKKPSTKPKNPKKLKQNRLLDDLEF